MKHILFLLILFLLSGSCFAQVQLDTLYPKAAFNEASDFSSLQVLSFPMAGCKYVRVNKADLRIEIFELDHQRYASFAFVDSFFSGGYYELFFVSEGLFHENGLFEYLLSGEDSLGHPRTLVLDQQGEIWLDEPAALPAPRMGLGPIYNLKEGARLLLDYSDGRTAVFQLPGHWPEGNCLREGAPVIIEPGTLTKTYRQDTLYLEGRRYYYIRDTLVVNEDEYETLSQQARPAVELADVQDADLQAGLLIRLSGLRFERGSAELVRGGDRDLKRLLELLETHPSMHIRLEGHTDKRIDAFYSIDNNAQLSLRRVAKIKNYLVKKGIDDSRIQTRGYGGERPIASNDREETRQLNRRVEVYVVSR